LYLFIFIFYLARKWPTVNARFATLGQSSSGLGAACHLMNPSPTPPITRMPWQVPDVLKAYAGDFEGFLVTEDRGWACVSAVRKAAAHD
jgi:hypothetical protein